VNAISVGAVETSALAPFLEAEGMREKMEARTPLRRIGSAEDITAAALWLASDAGGWVTGKIVEVDGGTETTNFHSRSPTCRAAADGAASRIELCAPAAELGDRTVAVAQHRLRVVLLVLPDGNVLGHLLLEVADDGGADAADGLLAVLLALREGERTSQLSSSIGVVDAISTVSQMPVKRVKPQPKPNELASMQPSTGPRGVSIFEWFTERRQTPSTVTSDSGTSIVPWT
jgi:hypothetical protein